VPVLEQVLESFPGKVQVVFKNYPLVNSHKLAAKAALTAYAAHLQGKFWPVHDEYFKTGENLTEEKIQEILRAQGLDPAQVERDANSRQVVDYVQRDLNETVRIGVNSVPAVFVNGKRQRDRGFEAIAAAVEKELRKKAGK
jgi:protein-disulfide isomerase